MEAATVVLLDVAIIAIAAVLSVIVILLLIELSIYLNVALEVSRRSDVYFDLGLWRRWRCARVVNPSMLEFVI